MIAEYYIVGRRQIAAAHQAEVGDVLLVQPAVGPSLLLAQAGNQAGHAHELLLVHATPESRVAGAKNGSQNAVAWRTLIDVLFQTLTLAEEAVRFRQPNRFGSIPFHRSTPIGRFGRLI